jgi:lipopolysaccharide/colanic/teichoic acid biosynthesis glycosyltransferase
LALKKEKFIDPKMDLSLRCYEATKRITDICLSVCALFCFLPVIIGVVIAIRLDSKGPAFFKQIRIGRYGIPFQVYKFRTMTVESPTFGLKPISFEDERITRLGKFLRVTSLDELPQLLNVIKGEMSMVGPRPEQPFLVKLYEDWQQERLNVLPGLTGWWQVNGRKQPMHEYIDEDIYYVQNRSVFFDVEILIKTVRAVLSKDGAI